MKMLRLVLLLSMFFMPPEVYSEKKAGVYKCYEDYMMLAESRLKAVNKSSGSIYGAVLMIQETIGVSFDDALKIYQYKSTPEMEKLEMDLDAIDSSIGKLMPFIQPDSGEKECKKRMKLEKKRERIADQLIREQSKSVLEDMIELRGKIDSLSDSRLLGKWKGFRDVDGCTYLSWIIELLSENKFEVTFYADEDQQQEIASESGQWNANPGNGMMILRTSGVRIPDVLSYKVINDDLVEYHTKNTGPSADCGIDYSFTEARIH